MNNNDEFRVPSKCQTIDAQLELRVVLLNLSTVKRTADTRAIHNQLSLDLEICP